MAPKWILLHYSKKSITRILEISLRSEFDVNSLQLSKNEQILPVLPENFFLRAPVGILARANLKCEGAKLEIQSATQNHPIFMPFLDFLEQ